MITDKETNFVYFSSKLKEWYEYDRIIKILDTHNIPYGELKETKDIWCRDYCPFQIDDDTFVQFEYKPSYLRGYPNDRTKPKNIPQLKDLNINESKINLDGGNIVKSKNKVIITDRIFSENCKELRDKFLIKSLSDALHINPKDIIIIPAGKEEITGHADGMVRFINDKIDNNRILVNKDLTSIKYTLKNLYNFDIIDFPVRYNNYDVNYESAIGIYINFLQVGNLIILPVFGFKEDDEAYKIIEKEFNGCDIETININRIGQQGGLMNCISWNVKK